MARRTRPRSGRGVRAAASARRLGLSDFTAAADLAVVVTGEPLSHLLRHQGSGADQRAVRVDHPRYEHRSLLLTANQPFGKWDTIFPDHAMTVAAVDRLIHRAAILELNVDSYRRRTAMQRQRRADAQPAADADPPAAAPETHEP